MAFPLVYVLKGSEAEISDYHTVCPWGNQVLLEFHRRKEGIKGIILFLFTNMFTSRGFESMLQVFLWDLQTYKVRPKLEGRNGELLFNGYEASVWADQKVLPW